MKPVYVALALATLAMAPTAYADLPCEAGGIVARSSDGRFVAESSAFGCRRAPAREITVREGGTPSRPGRVIQRVADVHYGATMYLSDDGRYLVVDHSDRDNGAGAGITVYVHGAGTTFLTAQLFGQDHDVVRERLRYDVSVDGQELTLRVPGRGESVRRPLVGLRS